MTMPLLAPLDQRWIKTLAHPTRVAILRELLDAQDANPSRLATALGLPLGTVSYHMRCLRDARQITLVRTVPRHGALAHHYRLSSRETTAAALRRFGLVESPARVTDHLAADRWAMLERAIRELRRRREARGISREALAKLVGIKPTHLISIECGETDPRLTVLIEIAHQLGTTLGEIFTLVDH